MLHETKYTILQYCMYSQYYVHLTNAQIKLSSFIKKQPLSSCFARYTVYYINSYCIGCRMFICQEGYNVILKTILVVVSHCTFMHVRGKTAWAFCKLSIIISDDVATRINVGVRESYSDCFTFVLSYRYKGQCVTHGGVMHFFEEVISVCLYKYAYHLYFLVKVYVWHHVMQEHNCRCNKVAQCQRFMDLLNQTSVEKAVSTEAWHVLKYLSRCRYDLQIKY